MPVGHDSVREQHSVISMFGITFGMGFGSPCSASFVQPENPDTSEVVFTSAVNVEVSFPDRTGLDSLNFHPPLELRLLSREFEYNLQRGILRMK